MIFGWPLHYKPIDTIRCLKFTFSDPNHSEQNIPFVLHEYFVLTQKIMPRYSYFLFGISYIQNAKYHYPDFLIKQGIQKAFSTVKQDLRKSN